VLKLRRKLLILQLGGLPRKKNVAYINFSNISFSFGATASKSCALTQLGSIASQQKI
jgi:hypothetical protein